MSYFWLYVFLGINLLVRLPIRIAIRAFKVENDKLYTADLISTLAAGFCFVMMAIFALIEGDVDTGLAVTCIVLFSGLFLLIAGAWLYSHIKERKENKYMDGATTNINQTVNNSKNSSYISKQIAAVISLLLCIALYLSFLTMAFTNERDTYICYTSKNDEYYHAAYCRYISQSSYETTVYEACKEYRPCSSCNPCNERYKTTITERNYIIPIIISVPISTVVYLLLTLKKKS